MLLAAEFNRDIARINRLTTDAQLARLAGCAPIRVSSGRSDRHRLDPGGNRQLNSAFCMLAIIRMRDDPRTAVYIARQRANEKDPERSDPQPQTPPRPPRLPPPQRPTERPNHHLLDIEDSQIRIVLTGLLLARN